MAVVPAEERSAAGGFTGVARTKGAAISSLLAGFLFARPSLISAPFFIAGVVEHRLRPPSLPLLSKAACPGGTVNEHLKEEEKDQTAVREVCANARFSMSLGLV